MTTLGLKSAETLSSEQIANIVSAAATPAAFIGKLALLLEQTMNSAISAGGSFAPLITSMVAYPQNYHRRQPYLRQAIPTGVPSAAPPRNPANAAVALPAVLGSKSVAMLVTHSLIIHGLRGFVLVKTL